jgi:zinc protease
VGAWLTGAGGIGAAAPLAHREVLASGAVLLVVERPAIPIVVVDVYIRAGAVLDPADGAGLANLTAALLTRGTARRTGPELDRAIEFVGGTLDAGAGHDGVTVSLAVLKKDLALGLDLLAEVLLTPTFPTEELGRKVAEIRGSLEREEQDPEAVAGRLFAAAIYPGHPYGRRVAGTIESVSRLTREQVAGFHRSHYRPDTAIISVVGDVKTPEVRQALWTRLGAWTAPASPPSAVATAPVQAAPATRSETRDLTQTTAMLGRPVIARQHPDYFPLLVANTLLGDGSASRLYTKVREERGLAYAVSSGLSPGRYGVSFVVDVQTRNEAVDEALGVVKDELSRLGREAVAEAELDLAKSYLIGSFPFRLDTSGKMAGFLIAVEDNALGLDYPETFKRRVAAVTAADVQRVAARYMDPATLSSVIVGGSRP